MTPTISKDAIVQFSGSGVLGAAFIDGIRFTPSTSVACNVPPNPFPTGFGAQTSVGVTLDLLVDVSFPGITSTGTVNGLSVPVSYVNPGNANIIYDNWSRT